MAALIYEVLTRGAGNTESGGFHETKAGINSIEKFIEEALIKRSSEARAKHANTAEEGSREQDELYW